MKLEVIDNYLYEAFLMKLKYTIHEKNIKYEAIALALKTQTSHVSEKLNGRTKIDLLWIFQLCISFDISPSELLDTKELDRIFKNHYLDAKESQGKIIQFNKKNI